MNASAKNVLIIGALILAGGVALGYKKVSNLMAIFEKMTIEPYSVPRNIRATWTQIDFNMDIILKNPTTHPFAVTGYVATLKQIMVYYKGTFLGVANLHLTEIAVPAYGSLVLPNVNIVVGTASLLSNAAALIPEMQTMSMNQLYNDLTFRGLVDVLGTQYEIEN
ncbi:MAG TPA: hypothetical protein VF581_07680 [Flavobacterium sp.]|jgi:hypothetical protein